MSLRFSRYAGTKLHFTDTFNSLTGSLNKKVYVEPFFGSGAIFFNLEREYELYVLNDVNVHVMNAVISFRDGSYDKYVNEKEDVFKQFGDISKDKSAYYTFRDSFNKEYFGTGKDKLTEGYRFHFLMNSCINSLVRIGPNGMNQSYGNRFWMADRAEYREIENRLNKKVIITSADYANVLDKYDSEDALIFLDPPYMARNEVGYQDTYNKDDLTRFLGKIKGLSASVVYTDIACAQHEQLADWIKEDTKILANISPNRKEEGGNQEVFFRNFEGKKRGSIALF